MIYDKTMNAKVFIKFCCRLIKDAGKKIYLILDNLRVHHSHVVRDWVQEHKDKIELFFLPSYSPELNPDEYLSCRVNNTQNPLGDTPLLEAARNNDAVFARELIARGADIDYYNEKSIAAPATALMQAAESNAVAVARLLIDHNAEVNITHKVNGMTPLMYAARSNAFETMEILLASGAAMEVKTFSIYGNKSALAIAAKSGAEEAVELLVKNGAKTKSLRAVKKDLLPGMKKWLKQKRWL